MSSAAVVLIGDELLSGQVVDQNLNYIAKELASFGIVVTECRIIPDDEELITEVVNTLRRGVDYVFTTGGVGPTHDDITTKSIAKAFGVKVLLNEKIKQRFDAYFGDKATPETYRMCYFPEGAELLENTTSLAPGYKLENVFVLAGIPEVMRAMFEAAKPFFKQAPAILEIAVFGYASEGKISHGLGELQQKYPKIKFGSYPFRKGGHSPWLPQGRCLVRQSPR